MNAHQPTNPAPIVLPEAETRSPSPGWLSTPASRSNEQTPAISRTLPAESSASAAIRSTNPGEEAATALRSRLLQMIVANEKSRKSPTAASPHE